MSSDGPLLDPSYDYALKENQEFTEEVSSNGDADNNSSVIAKICVGLVANFSAIYNYSNIGYALEALKDGGEEVPSWAKSAGSSAALWGSVVGMLVLGYIGDRIGRAKAMTLTLSLVAVGAVATATLSIGAWRFQLLVLWRFLLGVGMGGIFPLAAVSSAEAAPSSESDAKRNRRVSWGMIGIFGAAILCPLCMFAIEHVISSTQVKWRVMLASGAVPVLAVLAQACKLKDNDESVAARQAREDNIHPIRRALTSGANLLNIVAAGGSWFCLDFVYYSIAVSMPAITEVVFGVSSDTTVALINSGMTSLALPGFLLTVYLIDPAIMGVRRVQAFAFALMCASFVFLATACAISRDSKPLMGIAYALAVFAQNFGCTVTTYLLPQAIFPPEDRAFLNGLSAGIAKVGGAVGVMTYSALDDWSTPAAMCMCACIAAVGVVITYVFVPRSVDGR